MGRLLHTGGQVSWLAAHRPADAFPFPVASLSAVSPLTVTSSPGISTRFPFHRASIARHPRVFSCQYDYNTKPLISQDAPRVFYPVFPKAKIYIFHYCFFPRSVTRAMKQNPLKSSSGSVHAVKHS